ncbi:MAG: hypothetical protein GYA21_11485 [Myxococcales bacterium]|nr:hypothetical protein [Myxococcales bacterium]
MRRWQVGMAVLVFAFLGPAAARGAEFTDVIDAADKNDPFDLNVDIGFHSTLQRAKITHEWMYLWSNPQFANRPDFDELRFQRQIYGMDYTIEIGLYHDLELYVNLPWVIHDKKSIGYAKNVGLGNSTLYNQDSTQMPGCFPSCPGNSLAVSPETSPSAKRSGIGDMTVGVKWAPFNEERDDTKSVWVFGFEYMIPSGALAQPSEVAGGSSGHVGMGHHVLTPFFRFSHRMKALDPYVGLQGSIPIQGREAKNAGFSMPYHGGFIAGMEIIPWENKKKHQKFAIDLSLNTEFFGEVESKGKDSARGTVSELSDFLVARDSAGQATVNSRQLQAVGEYTQFGLHLGFVFRMAEFARFRFGVSLAHNTEHFITGADYCQDKTGEGDCSQPSDIPNNYRMGIYDDPGRRIRVEETTIFTYWLTGMLTF